MDYIVSKIITELNDRGATVSREWVDSAGCGSCPSRGRVPAVREPTDNRSTGASTWHPDGGYHVCVHSRGRAAAMWPLNGGLVAFIALFVTSGSRHGVLVVGIGALLGVRWALLSLRETPSGPELRAEAGVETTD